MWVFSRKKKHHVTWTFRNECLVFGIPTRSPPHTNETHARTHTLIMPHHHQLHWFKQTTKNGTPRYACCFDCNVRRRQQGAKIKTRKKHFVVTMCPADQQHTVLFIFNFIFKRLQCLRMFTQSWAGRNNKCVRIKLASLCASAWV